MTITHLCDILRKELLENGYEYGFLLNGEKVKPDFTAGFDREYDRLARTAYRVQSPALTRSEKIGTCIETVLVMKELKMHRKKAQTRNTVMSRSVNRRCIDSTSSEK